MYKECKLIKDEIISMRRDLHKIPEQFFDLPETCAYVKGKLDELGIPYEFNEEFSVIVGYINRGKGRVVALRADMDGLAISEANDIDYKSLHEGKMHACGHDCHTAMLLGAAKIINAHREEFNGEIRLIFQPYEEGMRGAPKVIELGYLKNVDMIFAVHIGTLMGEDIPSGKVITYEGPMMAVSDRFAINVKGDACHGSKPHEGVDPILIASHIVLAFQELPAREFSAMDNVVLSVGTINGGNQANAIPSSVMLTGTTRSYDINISNQLEKRMKEIAEGIAKAYRGNVDFKYRHGAAPVVNDPESTDLAVISAREVLGDENVLTDIRPIMVAEDFSYYQQVTKGTMIHLSSANHALGTDVSHHTPCFNVDEDVLADGAAVLVKICDNFFKI